MSGLVLDKVVCASIRGCRVFGRTVFQQAEVLSAAPDLTSHRRPHRQPQRINLRGMLGARDGVFEQACDTAQHNLQLDAPCFVQSLEQ